VVIGGTALAGGKGGVLSTTLGVFILTVLNNGLILAGVSPNFQSGIAGAILIGAIVIAATSQRDRLRIAK
jgi:ribose transport system permease protein